MMRRAAELALRAAFTAHPNPMVGCVIVHPVTGRLIGEGWHERAGRPHAEPVALAVAGDLADGADMYLTIEPCSHSSPLKRTPPCAPRVIASGVKRVAIGILDPNPEVSGRGAAALREAGVEVHLGLDAAAIAEDNRGFLSRMTRGRPWVTAKWAMTLDGRIASHTGDSKWISGSESRRLVHRARAASGAVMVGIGTVLADDPLLTARDGIGDVSELIQPTRVVVDPSLKLPADGRLARSARETPVVVFCAESADARKARALSALGVEVVRMSGSDAGLDMERALTWLGGRGVNNLLVEGGSRLLGTLFDAHLVDEVLGFLSPRVLLGGSEAPGPVGGQGVAKVRDAGRVIRWEHQTSGRDLLIRGLLSEPVSLLPPGSTVIPRERDTRQRLQFTPTPTPAR